MLPTLKERLTGIRAIVTDVDGCLTDGQIIYGNDETELKAFDVKDGMGCTLANRAGFVTGIITGRTSQAVDRRARELRFSSVFQGFERKIGAWHAFLNAHGLEDHHVAYLGDDLLDLPCLIRAGCSFAPADAIHEVRTRVHVVLERPGGGGAFREMVDIILKSHDRWNGIVEQYLGEG